MLSNLSVSNECLYRKKSSIFFMKLFLITFDGLYAFCFHFIPIRSANKILHFGQIKDAIAFAGWYYFSHLFTTKLHCESTIRPKDEKSILFLSSNIIWCLNKKINLEIDRNCFDYILWFNFWSYCICVLMLLLSIRFLDLSK